MKEYTNADLATIFKEVENAFFAYSSLSTVELSKALDPYKKIRKEKRTDNEYFWVMVYVTFYSGFKAKTVSDKLPAIQQFFNNIIKVAKYDEDKVQEIIDSKKIIGNRLKINGLIYNAKQIQIIQKKFGSFDNYINSFGDSNNDEVLFRLMKELKKRFKYLGGITVYHFLLDLGFNVLKPDRVLCRIFYRLGLAESKEDYEGVIKAGRRIAKATKLPIRYIDIIFVQYGQVGEKEEFGIADGICLKNNPKCELCGVIDFCQFESKKKLKGVAKSLNNKKDTDKNNSETVYISKYLVETDWGAPVYNRLKQVLISPEYNLEIIKNHTDNEWCRDYMPIHASDSKLVKFKYAPIYLMEIQKGRKTIPNVDLILSELDITDYEKSEIKLDGGAIEIYGRTGIISNRVIIENQPLSEKEICNEIKDKLKLDRIVIIPIHPDDYTGHVDGAVRFIDENTVLISDDREVLKEVNKLHTYKRQSVEQFFYSLRMSLYNAGLKWKYLTYVEGKQKDEKELKNNFNLYLNFLKLDNLILMPSYGMEEYDDGAKEDLEKYYGKEVIKINAKALSKKGGMINCVTWQK